MKTRRNQGGAIRYIAIRSGTITLGEAQVPVHVFLDGSAVVEVTTVEQLLGLPDAGLGAFLASLPGSDRVRFLRQPDPQDLTADRWATGLRAEKLTDMLITFWQAHNGTEAGARAAAIVRAVVRRGMQQAGVSDEGVDFLMAAAMPPRGDR